MSYYRGAMMQDAGTCEEITREGLAELLVEYADGYQTRCWGDRSEQVLHEFLGWAMPIIRRFATQKA